MSESDISIKRDYSQPYDVQPEKKSPEDIKMIEKAYVKAKLCKLCDGLDWTRGPQRITVWTLFVSAERDGCAGCLVLCGILATHASFSDALERSAWRLWPETLLFSMHNGLLRISKDDAVELFAVHSIAHHQSSYVPQLIVARPDGPLEDTFHPQCNEATRGYRLDSFYRTHLGLVAGLL
jgi:hypothetical protein